MNDVIAIQSEFFPRTWIRRSSPGQDLLAAVGFHKAALPLDRKQPVITGTLSCEYFSPRNSNLSAISACDRALDNAFAERFGSSSFSFRASRNPRF
ncbi:hypothetical protein CKAN_01931200 [Cinnamomum micranthum f. kanehirae]|uniref:Uncharacterized protein n=1 Tax=Cinnamomum micranthum f. kanehirae TaxID=337451 RepID=A0A443PHG7_9MAGN|nr:hypothetical protein CKAN_01931200 [Cinnamomum micranthum f. kanehirae]